MPPPLIPISVKDSIEGFYIKIAFFKAYLLIILKALYYIFYVGFRVKPEVFGLDTHVLYYTKGFW